MLCLSFDSLSCPYRIPVTPTGVREYERGLRVETRGESPRRRWRQSLTCRRTPPVPTRTRSLVSSLLSSSATTWWDTGPGSKKKEVNRYFDVTYTVYWKIRHDSEPQGNPEDPVCRSYKRVFSQYYPHQGFRHGTNEDSLSSSPPSCWGDNAKRVPSGSEEKEVESDGDTKIIYLLSIKYSYVPY